jgi:tight adherence protein B
VREKTRGALPAVDRLINASAAGPRVTTLLQQAGSRMTPGTLIVFCVVSGLALAILARFIVPNVLVMVAAGLIGSVAPLGLLFRQRTARLHKFEEQFPDALDLLSRAIRAGHAFQAAMGMVASELPSPVGPEFKRIFEQQNFGLPLREALIELADRVPLLDVRFFVTAVAIQRESGGNLAEILDNLAHVVRERFKIRRQVRVHTAHGRFTGYVLLGLPAFLAVALSFISPDQMKLLFYERIGQMMVLGAMTLQTIGFFWIRQVIKIEV